MLMKCGYREKIDFARWEVVMILSVLASVSLIISLRLLLVLMSILFLSGGRVEFRMLRLRFGSVDVGRPSSWLVLFTSDLVGSLGFHACPRSTKYESEYYPPT